MSIQAGVTFTQTRPIVTIPERVGQMDRVLHGMKEKTNYDLRVMMPGIVQSFNRENQTVNVNVAVNERFKDPQTGELSWITPQTLVNVPVHYPQGNGFVLTFDIAEGDEVMLVFADANIDSWWSQGGQQNYFDRRRHDLSDAIAIPGLNNANRVISTIAANATELRSVDGIVKISLQAGQATVSAPTVDVNASGTANISGTTTVNINSGTINLNGTTEIAMTTPILDLTACTTIKAADIDFTSIGSYLAHIHYQNGSGGLYTDPPMS